MFAIKYKIMPIIKLNVFNDDIKIEEISPNTKTIPLMKLGDIFSQIKNGVIIIDNLRYITSNNGALESFV